MKSLHSTRYRQFLALLIEARRSSGMSQQAVANELWRPQSFVSKYESGERRIDVIEFLMLAEIIGFDPKDLVHARSTIRRPGRARSTLRGGG